MKMLVKYFVSYKNTVESISPILLSNMFKISSLSISPIFKWCPSPPPPPPKETKILPAAVTQIP